MLDIAGIKGASIAYDIEDETRLMDATKVSRRGIVYKYSAIETTDFIPHQNVARVYFPIAMKAWRLRTQTGSQLATK